jgi:branched-chain amino acid transport system permease protein
VYSEGTVMTIIYLGIALIGGMAVSGGAAVGLERLAYRPLRKRNAPSLVFLITAIGASFVIQEFVHYVLPELTDGELGGVNAQVPIRLVAPEEQFTLFGASVTNITLIILVAAFILALGTDLFVNRTKFGRGIRSVAQDPTTATLMGVSRERVIILTFLIGGLLAGAAALLYTLRVPNGIIYSGGFILGIKAFCAAVLGGIGNLRGALLGGLILGVMENYGQVLFGTGWRDVVAFVLLILILMFRPTGILGETLGRARV